MSEDEIKLMKALHSRDQIDVDSLLKGVHIGRTLEMLEKRLLVKQGPSYIKDYAFVTSIVLTELGMGWRPPHV